MSVSTEQSHPTMSVTEAALRVITPRRLPVQVSRLSASRVDVDCGRISVPVWSVGDGAAVLLVHGWEGNHQDMAPIADELSQAGYRAVSLDLPGHGLAGGQTADIELFADAILAVVGAVGPLHGVVAHSMGAAATIVALKREKFTRRAVLIGAPAYYEKFARSVAKALGFDEAGRQAVLDELAGLLGPLSAHDTPRLAADLGQVRALFLHSTDDRVVELKDALATATAWPGGVLALLRGLGHKRILSAGEVHQKLLRFLDPQRMENRLS